MPTPRKEKKTTTTERRSERSTEAFAAGTSFAVPETPQSGMSRHERILVLIFLVVFEPFVAGEPLNFVEHNGKFVLLTRRICVGGTVQLVCGSGDRRPSVLSPGDNARGYYYKAIFVRDNRLIGIVNETGPNGTDFLMHYAVPPDLAGHRAHYSCAVVPRNASAQQFLCSADRPGCLLRDESRFKVHHQRCSSDQSKEHAATAGSNFTLYCDGCLEENRAVWYLDNRQLAESETAELRVMHFAPAHVGVYVCFCQLSKEASYRLEHRLTLLPDHRQLPVTVTVLNRTAVGLEWPAATEYTNRFGVVHRTELTGRAAAAVSYLVSSGAGPLCPGGRPIVSRPLPMLRTSGSSVVLDRLAPGKLYIATLRFSSRTLDREYNYSKTVGFSTRTDAQTTVFARLGDNVTLNGRLGLSVGCRTNDFWIYPRKPTMCATSSAGESKVSSQFLNLIVIPSDVVGVFVFRTEEIAPEGFETSDGDIVRFTQTFKIRLIKEDSLALAPPTKLRCQNFRGSSFILTWNRANSTDNRIPTKHRLIYWQRDNHLWRRSVDISGQVTHVHISDLHPGTVYKLALVSIDSGGRHSRPTLKFCSTSTVGETNRIC